MMTMVSDAQVLLLAAVLTGAGLAKLLTGEPAPQRPEQIHGIQVPSAEPGWAVLLRRSRPVAVVHGLVEVALGVALMLSAHPAVRVATVLLLGAATWVVGELRQRTPDAGCGCFGALSDERIGRREIARAALLTVAALATLGGTADGMQVLTGGPWQTWALCALELAALTALSREPAALLRRRRRPAVPCERRRSPLRESQKILRRSRPWRQYRALLDSDEPLDVWREGCWRFLAYPAHRDGRPVEVVFAVSTAHRDRTVRAAVLDPAPREDAPSAPAPATPTSQATGPSTAAPGAAVLPVPPSREHRSTEPPSPGNGAETALSAAGSPAAASHEHHDGEPAPPGTDVAQAAPPSSGSSAAASQGHHGGELTASAAGSAAVKASGGCRCAASAVGAGGSKAGDAAAGAPAGGECRECARQYVMSR